MDLQLDGKLVFISGSTKGIGRAIAEALLPEGARVIINGRSGTAEVAQELAGLGEVIAIEGDLADAEDSARVCGEIEQHGPLHVLVNNMGIFNPQPFAEISDDEWRRFLDINVLSTVRLSRHFFPKMLEQDFARIINIASEAGMRGLESMVHYSVTKGAQIVMGRGLANLTRGCGNNVTVNSVLPGPTRTEGVTQWLKESAAGQGKTEQQFVGEFFRETEPDSLLQRFIEPDEIAAVVAFLASPLSAAVNGASVRAEGGLIKSIG
ncbi:SDR family oxidoreductase [Microbulbifer salipaludis]|uniref:SDR family oxidoreductase n=1 Tax=Microbulbifer salipaludis TaxID=187980 RepID=A0ABS3E2D0_9GAMM|nr:SDR family oxidoreductase [Microbulbifer salipaludis]MBN8429430.1 SDR family oxidoreductase [Microbulbifer salipaludis]